MSNSAILHIEGKNDPNANKILHYSDGTVEVRTPDWKQVLEVYNIGREATMLDMENQFLKIYEDATPKDKAKKLRQRAKELAKEAGDTLQIAAIEAAEREAAEEDVKAAKAAKARKKKAGDKRSASLFKSEAESAEGAPNMEASIEVGSVGLNSKEDRNFDQDFDEEGSSELQPSGICHNPDDEEIETFSSSENESLEEDIEEYSDSNEDEELSA